MNATIGKCACGNDATMAIQTLISPTQATEPKPICFSCFQKRLIAMANDAKRMEEEHQRILRNN